MHTLGAAAHADQSSSVDGAGRGVRPVEAASKGKQACTAGARPRSHGTATAGWLDSESVAPLSLGELPLGTCCRTGAARAWRLRARARVCVVKRAWCRWPSFCSLSGTSTSSPREEYSLCPPCMHACARAMVLPHSPRCRTILSFSTTATLLITFLALGVQRSVLCLSRRRA